MSLGSIGMGLSKMSEEGCAEAYMELGFKASAASACDEKHSKK